MNKYDLAESSVLALVYVPALQADRLSSLYYSCRLFSLIQRIYSTRPICFKKI